MLIKEQDYTCRKDQNVNITFDVKDFIQSLQFSGVHADLNNYYAHRRRAESEFWSGREEHFSKEEGEFINLIMAGRKLLGDKLEAITEVPLEIREKEKRHLEYQYLQYKNMYQAFYHAKYTKRKDYKASDEFMKELNNIPIDRPDDYLYSSSYNYLINAMVVAPKASEEYEKNKDEGYLSALNKATMQLENESIRNLVLYDNVKVRLPRANNRKKVYDDFMNLSSNEMHKKKTTELYNFLSVLEPGRPSPKWENYENYAGGTTSLDDLKGKYAYIDVWATWCGPCIAEIPALEKIMKEYHGKNIEFVSISVDNNKDHDTWMKMVAGKRLSGIQLFADKALNSEFMKAYKISALPRFILLDPHGNIVTTNAPKPSDKKLIDLFNKHKI